MWTLSLRLLLLLQLMARSLSTLNLLVLSSSLLLLQLLARSLLTLNLAWRQALRLSLTLLAVASLLLDVRTMAGQLQQQLLTVLTRRSVWTLRSLRRLQLMTLMTRSLSTLNLPALSSSLLLLQLMARNIPTLSLQDVWLWSRARQRLQRCSPLLWWCRNR